jgi:hypothetical protein
MAINVDTVYKTVLLILNKEQRGYLTPDEFNKIATQVQLEIFEKYFEDLNQQLRVPENDSEFSNRVENIEQKLAYFYDSDSCTGSNPFTPPTNMHRIGTVYYNNTIEMQRVNYSEFLKFNKSPLTKPTLSSPIYLEKEGEIFVFPFNEITDPSLVVMSYIKKPKDVVWGYTVGTLGQFLYDGLAVSPTSVDFELHESEQTSVILEILMYAGVIVRDQQIIEVASAKAQQDEVNEKS